MYVPFFFILALAFTSVFTAICKENIRIQRAPYMVAVLENNEIRGTGTIIRVDVILTAASAIEDIDAKSLRVRAGSDRYNQGGTVIEVSESLIHENYRGYATYWDYDVALLRLELPLLYSPKISKILILNELNITSDTSFYSGYAHETETDPDMRPTYLRAMRLEMFSHKQCQHMTGLYNTLTPRMTCAGQGLHMKNWLGDFGGPLVSDGVQVALLSSRLDIGVGVFTNIPSHFVWIQENAEIMTNF